MPYYMYVGTSFHNIDDVLKQEQHELPIGNPSNYVKNTTIRPQMSLLPLPTHTEVASFLQKLLPTSSNAREVPFLFHTPRHLAYNPSLQQTSSVVLSITPTHGFYSAINDQSRSSAPVCFLHRPWTLDRKVLRRGSLVFSSHASFDEHLTVGWNTALARRIGLDLMSRP
jgi:hypothetical protein